MEMPNQLIETTIYVCRCDEPPPPVASWGAVMPMPRGLVVSTGHVTEASVLLTFLFQAAIGFFDLVVSSRVHGSSRVDNGSVILVPLCCIVT